MELININDAVREEIGKFFDKQTRNGKTKEEVANIFRDSIYSIEPESIEDYDSKNEKDRINLIRIIFLDAIKMTIYKHKNGLVNDEELIFFNNLTSIENEDELFAEVSADPSLFSKMILECSDFIELNIFSRISVFKSLSPDENNFLCKTYKLHLVDSFKYNQKVTLKDTIENLNEVVNYQKKYIGEVLENNIVALLSGFISNIVRFDGSNSLDFILDIGKVDYSVCIYLSKYIEDDIILDHIDFYENYSIDDILYKLSSDQIFLKDALWMLIALYIDKEYNDIELSDEVLKTKESQNISKKLVIK